jgi:hypothetical protein
MVIEPLHEPTSRRDERHRRRGSHGIVRNGRFRSRKGTRFLTSGLTDLRWHSHDSGAALLSDGRTIPDLNGLNADPCGDALPPSPGDRRRPEGQTGVFGDSIGVSRNCTPGRAGGCADEFARRHRPEFHCEPAGQFCRNHRLTAWPPGPTRIVGQLPHIGCGASSSADGGCCSGLKTAGL